MKNGLSQRRDQGDAADRQRHHCHHFCFVVDFVPVGLMAGITGKIYQQFAVTIATSIVFSAFNALTLSPSRCALFSARRRAGTAARFFKWFDDVIDRGKEKYLGAVKYFSSKLMVTVVVTAITIAVLAVGFKLTPTSFCPKKIRDCFCQPVIARYRKHQPNQPGAGANCRRGNEG